MSVAEAWVHGTGHLLGGCPYCNPSAWTQLLPISPDRTATASNFALTLRRLRRLALSGHATPARVAA
jgi:hypothetical protein